MELVIMAAGMGSRFGGLKQIEPVDSNGNFIIDYSIYDAIRCGFNKVIFIIKEENFNLFRSTVGSRVEKLIKTEYVFQNNKNIPSKYEVPETRTKPFGTGHAVLCAKPAITSGFAVINADDFYGYDAFRVLSEFLKNNNNEDTYSIVGFRAVNTFGNSGSVKRGVCASDGKTLKTITESKIDKLEDGSLSATAIDGSDPTPKIIAPNTIVSMNMFGFSKTFAQHLESYFVEFLEENKNNLDSCEYFLPTVVSKLIESNKASVDVLDTSAKWYGITYKEDLQEVISAIKDFVANGVYPANLWEKED